MVLFVAQTQTDTETQAPFTYIDDDKDVDWLHLVLAQHALNVLVGETGAVGLNRAQTIDVHVSNASDLMLGHVLRDGRASTSEIL
jgi:hypothetical protein